jgi:abequosyltransferase
MKLLTIAIPTYNRVNYLRECLDSLVKNNIDFDNVEILILDNYSTDNTKEIIQKYKHDLSLRYICNENNIGPDENFKKCIKKSNSKYIWIFGDDDLFFNSSVENVLKIISTFESISEDIGLLHLRAENFTDFIDLNKENKKVNYEIFTNDVKFMANVHTNITFLSSNIFNKKLVCDYLNLNSIPNNHLGQVYWNIVALKNAKKNVFVKSNLFGARQFNSGNYNFCEVFVQNFMDTLYLINNNIDIKEIIKVIKKRLLRFYYPANIIRIRNELSDVKYESCWKYTLKRFKYNFNFWIFTVPAMLLPCKISLFILKLFEKVVKK